MSAGWAPKLRRAGIGENPSTGGMFSPGAARTVRQVVVGLRPVELVGIHTDLRDLEGDFAGRDLGLVGYQEAFVGEKRTARPGVAGRMSTWRQFLFGVLPSWSHPRRLPALEAELVRRPPALVVLYLAPAHLPGVTKVTIPSVPPM